MKSTLYRITIEVLNYLKKFINLNPAYQRDYIAKDDLPWQQGLVGGIFEGNNVIPNLYARTNSKELATAKIDGLTKFGLIDGHNRDSVISLITEMIDGQQRFRTITDFLDNKFPLGVCVVQDWEAEEHYNLSGMYWEDVQTNFPEAAEKFLQEELRISTTFSKNESQVMDMFCKLNNLQSMTAQEKRNAIDTAMGAYIRGTARLDNKWNQFDFGRHELFDRDSKLKSLYLALTFKKMAQDELLAKITSLVDGIGFEKGIGNKTLNLMYWNPSYKLNFDGKKVKKLLDVLYKMLEDKRYRPKMNVGVTINLAMIVLYLMNNKSIRVKNWHNVMDWFMTTHNKLSDTKGLPLGVEETNYHQKTRLASDSKGLEIRRQYLLNELDSCSGLIGVDPKRVIDDKEFFELWLQADDGKGNKVCQSDDCSKTLRFDEAIKGHRKAWSEGGKTTVENTIVVCSECNKPRD